jgi:hypothetical protein
MSRLGMAALQSRVCISRQIMIVARYGPNRVRGGTDDTKRYARGHHHGPCIGIAIGAGVGGLLGPSAGAKNAAHPDLIVIYH